MMDTDSSYGGSDTSQDLTTTPGADHSAIIIDNGLQATVTIPEEDRKTPAPKHEEISTVYLKVEPSEDKNQFYHKNEVTLPVLDYDTTDAEVVLSVNGDQQPNLQEQMASTFKSTTKLHQQTPKAKKRPKASGGLDNPGFEDEPKTKTRSSFGENKKVNGDLNTVSYEAPVKADEQMTEAVNLELINLKPSGKDVVGPFENGGKNGASTAIPVKKEPEAELSNPYDEYFVPVNEHRKYMR